MKSWPKICCGKELQVFWKHFNGALKTILMKTPKNLNSKLVLAHKTIWLTRPLAQLSQLKKDLELLGAQVLALPLLDIRPLPIDSVAKQRLLDLDCYDLVFFISTNAAQIGLDVIFSWWPQYPAHIVNFAVGPSTAAIIESAGLLVKFPKDRTSSEALLELPQLQKIEGKKVLIVRGAGGREILAEGLVARGASVDYIELYERRVPEYSTDYLRECLLQHKPDAVVISSAEALDNLQILFSSVLAQHDTQASVQLLAPKHGARNSAVDWRCLPLRVSSPRLAEHALIKGFLHIKVMAGATDMAIINTLVTDTSEHLNHE